MKTIKLVVRALQKENLPHILLLRAHGSTIRCMVSVWFQKLNSVNICMERLLVNHQHSIVVPIETLFATKNFKYLANFVPKRNSTTKIGKHVLHFRQNENFYLLKED